jgi:hypothetical protein
MIVFWLLCVSLVLGGVAGLLCSVKERDRLWHWAARVPLRVRRPIGQRDGERRQQRSERGGLLPSPRVMTRPRPPYPPPA